MFNHPDPRRPRRFSCKPLLVGTAWLLVGTQASAETPAVTKSAIEFVTQVRTDQGSVVCALFDQRGWLKSTRYPARARIVHGRATCVFRQVAAGTYGISAFHDTNDNGKLDTNFLGIPTEDYCASRDARGVMGPPSFDDAKFNYDGAQLRLFARMR